LLSRIHSSLSNSPVFRATAGLTRKHGRLPVLAATAAATGVIGATVAISTTPWTHEALGSASQSTAASAQIQSVAHSGTQLDSLRSAATGGSTAVLPSVGQPAQQKPVAAVADAATAKVVAKPAIDAKAAAAAKAKAVAAAKAKAVAAAKAKAVAAAKAKAVAVARAKAAAAAKAKAAAAAKKPYQIYDSVTPGVLPTDKAAAVYANGAYAASASQMSHHKSVLWIDTNGSNPNANVLDVEPGDATPAGAAAWVQHRLTAHPNEVAIVYTMKSAWGDVKSNVGHLPSWMQHKVRYWIADPTGNPHVVPGSSATQWYWGKSVDITTANPNLTR
jgi:hypothetical protein